METVARQAAGLWMKRYQDCKAFEYLKKKKKNGGFSEKFQKSKEVQITFTKCLYEKGKQCKVKKVLFST